MIIQGKLLIDPSEPPRSGSCRVENGRIVAINDGDVPETRDAGSPDSIVCAGFYDAHVHLPQIGSIGCDGRPLLEWLDRIIYPAESKWSDAAFARRQASAAFYQMFEAGTLGFAGYLSSHPHGLDAVRHAHEALPLRAVVGQSWMDRNAAKTLLPGVAGPPVEPLPETGSPRLRFSVNPRFALACTDELLRFAARVAGNEAFVQTHLAEQEEECRRVRELFPDRTHYTDVYDDAGLLHERTLLAHCVHLAPEEWRVIAERQSVVVHCPGANTFLESGLFDLAAAREHGVRLALGSDVAAGPDLSMPRVARAMIEVAKQRRSTVTPDAPVPTPADVWRLITERNADALGFENAGRLAVGAPADLLVLDPDLPIDDDFMGRLIYTWRDEYITHRILDGVLFDSLSDLD